MSLADILDLAMEIEQKLSRCYEAISRMSPSENFTGVLHKFAQQEINHMNVLKTGKNYVFLTPELFDDETMSEEELKEGLNLVNTLLEETENRELSLAEGLKRIYELEKRLEQVHMKNAVELKDPSLERLFMLLSKGDKEHSERLEKIVASL